MKKDLLADSLKNLFQKYLFLFTILFNICVFGQIDYNNGTAITENFNSLGASASASLPSGWKVNSSTIIRATAPTYASSSNTLAGSAAGNSMSNVATNGIYRYNANGSTAESAIGGLTANSGTSLKSMFLYLGLKNTSLDASTSFDISYDVEKYRNGSNPGGYSVQLFYSLDGSTWVSCGTDFLTTFSADVDNSGFATSPGFTQSVSKTFSLPAGTTIATNANIYFAWRYSVAGSGTSGSSAQALGVDNPSITASSTAAATISTGSISGSPFCVTATLGSSVDVPFTSTGTFTTNTYMAQLSNASGSFASAISIGTLASNALSGTISATIPANTTTGTLYRIRVVASNPATTGTDNGSDLIINLAKNSVAPAATQSLPEGVSGNAITVTETATPSSRVWKYTTTSGTGYTAFSPSQTGTSYTPNFATSNSYYMVCESTFPCGTVTSNEVVINVSKPTITITAATSLFTYPQGQGPSASQSVSVSGVNLASDITVTVPSTNWEISTNVVFSAPSSSIILAKNASNTVSSTTIYVRLKAGLSEGQYNFLTDSDLQAVSANAVTKTVDLDGEVTEPKAELNVRGVYTSGTTSNIIPNGDITPNTFDNTEFASQNIGASQSKTFRLENIGGLALNVSSISLDNNSDFFITASAPYNIAGSTYQDFTITFQPISAGDRTSVVTIANSDLTDSSYTFTVLGLGKNPEIGVTGNGNNIADGNTAISASDYTLIGTANVNPANTTTVNKTFVISNSGNVALTISSIGLTGVDASQFSVSPTSTSIAVGSTGIVTVIFSPTSSGVKNAILNIANNDATDNENPYTFAVQGSAVNYITCAAGSLGASEVIGNQDFETPAATPTWAYASTGGSVTGGTAYAVVGASNATVNKFLGSNSYQVFGGTGILDFNFNTSSYQDVELSFRLGSFSLTTGNGAEAADNVKISISTDNNIFIDELLIKGLSNNKWGFGASGSVSTAVNSSLDEFASPSGDSGISTVTLTNLPKVENLYIRMTALNSDNNEIWAIDNVTLKGKLSAGISEKTWDGNVWSGDGLPPTSSQKAIIDGNFSLPYTIGTTTYEKLEACKCQVNTGKTFYIGATDDINKTSVPANAIIQSDFVNNGTVVLASGSNLQQLDPNADNIFTTSNFVAKRFSKLPKMGYTYWSSPVAIQNLYTFSDGGTATGTPKNRFWQYDEATDRFKNTGAFLLNDDSVFETAKGYAIRGQNQFTTTMPTTSHEFAFTGIPNNGDLSFVNLKYSGPDNGYNLVGNPYPSNIDFDELYNTNSTKIYATAYFWTNNDMLFLAQQGSGYSGNNYAVYNFTGGTPAAEPDPNQPGNPVTNPTPTNVIKVGQGFIIRSKSAGANQPLNFTNEMRVVENGVFFNNKKSAEKNRFWLRLTTPSRITNTILVGYIPTATNGFEIDYDAELFVVGSDSFYSILGSKKLAIQGKKEFNTDDKVDIGNVYSQSGNYTISLRNAEGVFNNAQNIYLKDNLLNKTVNLTDGEYAFQAVKGTDATRFQIVYKDDAVLGTDETLKADFLVYRDGSDYVISSRRALGKIDVYDVSGRLLISQKTNKETMRLNTSTLKNGVYIIKIENSGDVRTTKIIK